MIWKIEATDNIADSSECGVFVPQMANNPGFDFLVRYATADNKRMNILYAMKFSDPTSKSPETLSKQMIDDNYMLCRNNFGDDFILVVLGWRECDSTVKAADLPPNTVVFDKAAMKQLYGPSLANFLDIQLTDEPLLVADLSLKQNTKPSE